MVSRTKSPSRRRFDAQVLRWQARLEGPWCDRFVPWIAAGALFVLLVGLALAQARSLDDGVDLAAWVQGSWLIANGHDATVTISGSHVLAQQLPIGLYPVAWLTKVLPIIPTLLVVQAAGVASGVVPLWRMARRIAELRVGATVAVVVAFGASPVLNDLNLNDFHPAAVAVGPLLAASYAALRLRWRWFALWSALAVVWSAELSLVVAGMGVLAFLHGNRKAGSRVAVAGLAWAVIAIVWLEPRYGSAGFVAPGSFNAYGDDALSILGGMATHPFQLLGDLIAEENVRLLVRLFAPLLFLPVLAPKYLLPAVPLQALYLVAVVPAPDKSKTALVLPLTVFAFVAAIFALQRMGRRSIERVVVDRRVLIALSVGAVALFSVEAANSPYNRPWQWGRLDAVDGARHEAADSLADSARVRAAASVLPLVAERRVAFALGDQPDAAAAVAGVDGVIVDASAVDWAPIDWLQFTSGMVAAGFRVTYQAEGITVYGAG